MLILFGIALISLKNFESSKASMVSLDKTSSVSCDFIKSYFIAEGFPMSEIPDEPVSSKDLKTCVGINNNDSICCSLRMENFLLDRVRNKYERITKETLQQLQNILHIRAVRFQDFFHNLLKSSKKSFHEMFKKTYGILYEQNAYVFIDLFQELEIYHYKGSVDLDDVMDTFFNTLYQKMFIVLNSQYKFDNKYLECVSLHMKDMRPFGDIPQKLGVQIKRSFVATRAFSQALSTATEVIKNMQQLKLSNECTVALTRITACSSCGGLSNTIHACNDMCENIMKGCLAQYAALDADWNHFIEALDKVADRLLGPFNIEMLVRPINLKISEAIMNFQESSSDVSQRVFTGCGRPVLGRRRRMTSWRSSQELEELKSFHFKKDKEELIENDEEHSSSAIILDKLVKEIKQRVRDSKQFWLYLPYKLCNNVNSVISDNNLCWNGTHIDKHVNTPVFNAESQKINPDVRGIHSRIAIVREQVYSLSSISSRLRSAFDGHDVEWIDTEESWSSGSGSGDSNLDSVTDDEDGLTEDGSGYEKTIKPIKNSDQNIMKLKERFFNSSSPQSTTTEMTEKKLDKKTNLNDLIDSKNSILINGTQLTSSGTTIFDKYVSIKTFLIFFTVKTTIWIAVC